MSEHKDFTDDTILHNTITEEIDVVAVEQAKIDAENKKEQDALDQKKKERQDALDQKKDALIQQVKIVPVNIDLNVTNRYLIDNNGVLYFVKKVVSDIKNNLDKKIVEEEAEQEEHKKKIVYYVGIKETELTHIKLTEIEPEKTEKTKKVARTLYVRNILQQIFQEKNMKINDTNANIQELKKNMINATGAFNEANKSTIKIIKFGSNTNSALESVEDALIFQQDKILELQKDLKKNVDALTSRITEANIIIRSCGRTPV